MKKRIMKLTKKRNKLTGTAFLSAILILFTCIIFIMSYEKSFMGSLKNNLMILKYFSSAFLATIPTYL